MAKAVDRFMTLDDGTEVQVGNKVRARGEDGKLRVCKVLELQKNKRSHVALLTAPVPFGTLFRSSSEIKPLRKK